jgi:hypothetical protein
MGKEHSHATLSYAPGKTMKCLLRLAILAVALVGVAWWVKIVIWLVTAPNWSSGQG